MYFSTIFNVMVGVITLEMRFLMLLSWTGWNMFWIGGMESTLAAYEI